MEPWGNYQKNGLEVILPYSNRGITGGKKMTFLEIILQLMPGIGRSVLIFFFTLVFSIPLGFFITFGRMSRCEIVRILFKGYISLMRGTPLMLQLLAVYFGPYFIFGITITDSYRLYAVLIAFSINYAAYFAEIYRGGIVSIEEGQYEAAKLLGYSKVQTFFRIILPQVIKRILPSITNEVITLVKDTSLSFAIAYGEMFTMTKSMVASQRNMFPFVVAGIFYYIFNLIVAVMMEQAEKKLSYYR